MSTFRQAVQLSRLSLPLCNDLLLKAIAVYCRYGDYLSSHKTRVADPGYLSRIPEPNFSIPHPESEFFQSRFPDPEFASKNLRTYFNPKMVSKLSEI
jgi:hypothetical protein